MNLAQIISVWALPLLFAITLHEVAHGWMARYYGDTTAQMLGRLTLNPIKHIDPVGTLLVPGVLIALGGIVFGWAKPVPVNSNNLHDPRRHMAIVAAAGPLANLAMALVWALVMKLGLVLETEAAWVGVPLSYMGKAGITINLLLMVLNCLPIPPLDGGRVLSGLLPPRTAARLEQVEPYGLFILIALLVTGVLGAIIWPVFEVLATAIQGLFLLP